MTIETILAILNSILLGLSAWTLYTVHSLAVISAGREERDRSQDEQIKQVRARVIHVESDVRDLQLDMVEIGGRKRK